MKQPRLVAVLLALLLIAGIAVAKKKKRDENPGTQTLPLVEDPPSAVVTDAEHLVFRVAPLSPKGLLSQQVRDGLKALIQGAHGATIVKIRAFVAGTGDLRRVQTIVSEIFSERKLPLPALSSIQGGALPGDGVQVALEAMEAQKKMTAPQGLAFISGQPGEAVGQSIGRIQTALGTLAIGGDQVLAVTCFVSSLDNYLPSLTAVMAAFPAAATNFVQMQRVPVRTPVECEAVAALARPVPDRMGFVNPDGLAKSPNYSQVALVGPGRLVITGTQLGFGVQDADIQLAFERLGRALEANHAGFKDVVYARVYPVSDEIGEKVRALRFGFFDSTRPPASTMLTFEALPSLDATFGVEVMAAPR